MEDLAQLFGAHINHLKLSREAKAYLTGLFVQQAVNPTDLSQESITLMYLDVRRSSQLSALQSLGDWILWSDVLYPEHIMAYHEYAEALAQASYYRCYKLVPTWRVYEELADMLPIIAKILGPRIASSIPTRYNK